MFEVNQNKTRTSTICQDLRVLFWLTKNKIYCEKILPITLLIMKISLPFYVMLILHLVICVLWTQGHLSTDQCGLSYDRDINEIFYLGNQACVWHGGYLILSVSIIKSIFVLHSLLLTQYISGKLQKKIFLPNDHDVIVDSQTDTNFPPFLNKFIVLLIFKDIFPKRCI